ncbi:hypothetical protein Tco_1315390 [Tanacetum coccineum]
MILFIWQNKILVTDLPLLVYSKGNPCSSFYIHYHKDHLGKFDENTDKDSQCLQNKKKPITSHESPDTIKFTKHSVDNINIAESERYPPNEYLHPYETSQRFFYEEEPKKVSEALKHPGWVDALQDELNQFSRNKVWRLVLAPYGPGLNGKAVNETQYKGMIGSPMYLTASRHDIQFSTCLCARYHANPKESHLIAVKRIFRYPKGTPSLGLWYPKCSGFDLKGYSDSDYAGCNMDRKITSGACELLGGNLVCRSAKKQQS